jgi:hypothetical protein
LRRPGTPLVAGAASEPAASTSASAYVGHAADQHHVDQEQERRQQRHRDDRLTRADRQREPARGRTEGVADVAGRAHVGHAAHPGLALEDHQPVGPSARPGGGLDRPEHRHQDREDEEPAHQREGEVGQRLEHRRDQPEATSTDPVGEATGGHRQGEDHQPGKREPEADL